MWNWKKAWTGSGKRVGIEALEERCLLSGNPMGGGEGGRGRGGPGGGFSGGTTIAFSQLSKTIQNGLDALATTDGVTAPATTQAVILGNTNGVETYTVDITGTGTDMKLTVDQNGQAVTAPTHSTTTFGAITNTAVTGELTVIASALNLSAPTSTTTVEVTMASDGSSTYSLQLSTASTTTPTTTTSSSAAVSKKKKSKKTSGSTSSTTSGTTSVHGSTTITVDSNGNPVGNESVPLSTLSTVIQNGLTSNAPSGATALTASSLINVRTLNGVTFYSMTYTSTGTRTTVTVNATGTLTSLPSSASTTFAAIPSAAQTELQTLATANGVTTTIATTQAVTAYDQANGTVIYSVRLTATGTSSSGSTYTYPLTISVDENGNPTVAPLATASGPGLC